MLPFWRTRGSWRPSAGYGMPTPIRASSSGSGDRRPIWHDSSGTTPWPLTQVLRDTQVRVARIIRGPGDQVWHAHTDAALMKQWLLGPDGWSMPVCEVATTVGDSYRYEWKRAGGDERFGFTGELLESEKPYRAVTTEAMIGMDFPATLNELTLTAVEGGTLLSLVITYANAEQRDAVLTTGMTDGMETSYQRLEGLLQPTLA